MHTKILVYEFSAFILIKLYADFVTTAAKLDAQKVTFFPATLNKLEAPKRHQWGSTLYLPINSQCAAADDKSLA